mmetsp:Transcript_6859/g.17815  ORF Transcript_6859/g.17815 Transcript_6859/m.17815 type:complete len:112 (-) Transcript_6859:191-526(-)
MDAEPTILADGHDRNMKYDECEPAKRIRPDAQAEAATPRPMPEALQPQAWPSQASLYAQGLEARAESLPSDSFTVQGGQWRAQHLNQVDSAGSEMRQRQAAARKAMLHSQR